MRVLLAIEDAAGMQLLRRLHDGPDSIVAVLALPRGDGGGASTWGLAGTFDLPRWSIDRLDDPDLPDHLHAAGVDVLLNVYSLAIVPGPVLEALPLGGWNLHPGPLPRYAGLHSVSWAIRNGEIEHGVTVHRMVPTVDLGAIAFQERFAIAPDATALQVAMQCVTLGLPLMERLVQQLREDPRGVPVLPQEPSLRTFFGAGVPDGGRVAWTGPARSVVDLVRACDYAPLPSPWGAALTSLRGVPIEVLRVSITGVPADRPAGTIWHLDGSVLVACADTCVRLERIRLDGRVTDPTTMLHPGDRFDA